MNQKEEPSEEDGKLNDIMPPISKHQLDKSNASDY